MPTSSDPRPILITGTTGQVGSALRKLYPHALAPTRAELDLTSEPTIRAYLQHHRPGWIINPAAYTAVDRAESESALAHAINAEAPRILGEEAARLNAPILHFSTDYVFDGSSPNPYRETDPTHPTSVYGASKLAGEQALAATGATYLILRTSWVYAATGKNFLLTILRLARERAASKDKVAQPLKIVADQHGAPTSARDLARVTAQLIASNNIAAHQGVFHATGSGSTTWHGFASEIVRQARLADPATPYVDPVPIPSSEFPTPAKRPLNSRLDCTHLTQTFSATLLPWQQALAEVFTDLKF